MVCAIQLFQNINNRIANINFTRMIQDWVDSFAVLNTQLSRSWNLFAFSGVHPTDRKFLTEKYENNKYKQL